MPGTREPIGPAPCNHELHRGHVRGWRLVQLFTGVGCLPFIPEHPGSDSTWLLIPASCSCSPWKEAGDSSRPSFLPTVREVRAEFLVQSDPIPLVTFIRGVDQQMCVPVSLSSSLSNKMKVNNERIKTALTTSLYVILIH